MNGGFARKSARRLAFGALASLGIGALLLGCAGSHGNGGIGSAGARKPGDVVLTEKERAVAGIGRFKLPGVVVVGRTVIGFPGGPARLAESPSRPLTGESAPLAALSPDGSQIAYTGRKTVFDRTVLLPGENRWEHVKQDLLSLRVFSTTGADTEVAKGGYTPAWRSDGALAYAQMTNKSGDLEHWSDKSDILVRDAKGGKTTKWSSKPAFYLLWGWANQRLITYQEHECETLEVLAFDGPGKSRSLGYGFIIAIDPSGELIAISPSACGDDSAQMGALEIVRIRDGRVLARVSKSSGSTPYAFSYSGSWRGNVIAAEAGWLALFRYSNGHLSLVEWMRRSKKERNWGWGMTEPVLLDRSSTRIAGIATLSDPKSEWTGYRLVVCDRTTGSCDRGRVTSKEIGIARNVSQPQPGW